MQNLRYESGLATFHKLHGGHSGEDLVNNIDDICPEITTMAMEWVFGDIMQRPGLDIKTRELAIIAALVTQNLAPQTKAHIEAALRVGASQQEIIEVILQTAIYAGFPVAINGMAIAKEVFLAQQI